MGNIKDLVGMIPGVGNAVKDLDIDDDMFKYTEAMIYSMTPEERAHPSIIDASRRKRIAQGAGRPLTELNRLLKQFDQTRKMMKMATSMKNPMKMMRQMKQQGGRRF